MSINSSFDLSSVTEILNDVRLNYFTRFLC